MKTVEHHYKHTDRVDVIEQCSYPDVIKFYGWYDVPGARTAIEWISMGPGDQYTVAIFKIKYKQ